jgi:hypothetical protein
MPVRYRASANGVQLSTAPGNAGHQPGIKAPAVRKKPRSAAYEPGLVPGAPRKVSRAIDAERYLNAIGASAHSALQAEHEQGFSQLWVPLRGHGHLPGLAPGVRGGADLAEHQSHREAAVDPGGDHCHAGR